MTYEDALQHLAQANERLLVLTAENRAAIRNLPEVLGDRFIDFGIAEQTMVGAAAGMALRGRIPVVHALATFLTMRAFEHIRTDVGIPDLPVKFMGAVPGVLSEANGPTHQAIEDISLMRGIPSMEVYCPADGVELVEALPHIVESASPVYVRFNTAPPAYRHAEPFEPGKAETVLEGQDVTILTYGFLVREALKAGKILSGRGVSTRVVNMRTLKPIDEDVILSSLADTELTVILEDHLITGGLYSIVSEIITRYGVRMHNVLPIALQNRWFHPCLLDDVLKTEGFTGELVADRVCSVLP